MAVTLVVVLSGDESGKAPVLHSPSARQDLAAAALSDLVEAVESDDRDALEGVSSPDVASRLADNAADLEVTDFTLRYVDEDRGLSASLPEGRWAAAVDATWRFDGFDPAPAHAEITVVFDADDETARVVAFGGGERRTPLWLLTDLAVERTEDALVLVAADSVGRYASEAREAVAVSGRMLPEAEQKLVVEVPDSAARLDAMLDASPGDYANIAAVTTTVDGSLSPSAPVHVFVNPQMWAGLKPQGAQVVMSHEAAHVATGAAVTSGVPLWLLEGFADYVALRDVDVPVATSAGQIIKKVRADGAPKALPGRNEFDTRTTHLGAAYESAWLVCRVLAKTGSEDALVALYDDVSAGTSLADALKDHFELSERELVDLWRTELEDLAR
ncbi:hypothetical protein BJ980_000960 [Nocardioides daedukensis]|uniref:Peptidase MA-like domain-containing protein n=1 Tax=Nocardioides daedukensis TaxID=634462 RepID=A0A7Y9S054_9ACTN|nr:hypothetical protein [Nocardioides daedukensis]NYG58037.1 hypothetical protein [Nocardioides daedukensis]